MGHLATVPKPAKDAALEKARVGFIDENRAGVEEARDERHLVPLPVGGSALGTYTAWMIAARFLASRTYFAAIKVQVVSAAQGDSSTIN